MTPYFLECRDDAEATKCQLSVGSKQIDCKRSLPMGRNIPLRWFATLECGQDVQGQIAVRVNDADTRPASWS